MWQKLKEQLPAVLITIVVIGGTFYWLHQRTIDEMAAQQKLQLDALREQTNAELHAAAEDTRRQIDAVNTLLKDAIKKRSADVFLSDEEVLQMNNQRIGALADAIAQKIQPYKQVPQTPEEAEAQQNAQIDKVSNRLADRISPILDEMSKDQHLTREAISGYSERISDQISIVLTTELAKNQQLNQNLQDTQAVAADAMQLSHELTALYLSGLKDQGVLTRLLSLPANVVKDVSTMSIISSSDRKKKEEALVGRMNQIEARLDELRANNPKSPMPAPAPAATPPATESAPTRPAEADTPAATQPPSS